MIDWKDISHENEGRPAWTHDVAPGRDLDTYPGVDVSYGQRSDGRWSVRIDLFVDGWRRSDEFATEAEAKGVAEAVAAAFGRMWP